MPKTRSKYKLDKTAINKAVLSEHDIFSFTTDQPPLSKHYLWARWHRQTINLTDLWSIPSYVCYHSHMHTTRASHWMPNLWFGSRLRSVPVNSSWNTQGFVFLPFTERLIIAKCKGARVHVWQKRAVFAWCTCQSFMNWKTRVLKDSKEV